MSDESNIHLDILGRELTVKALTPKMVRVEPVKKQFNWPGKSKTYLEYSDQMVIIGGEDVLMYVLKHGG